ncbi:MAG: hypothetical protein WCJ30_12125, partial [Deltaproteobacteria bacterium]
MATGTTFEARESLDLVHASGAIALVRSGTKTFEIDLRTGAATQGEDAPPRKPAAEPDLEDLAGANWARALELGIGADAVPIYVSLQVSGAIVTVDDGGAHDVGPRTTITSGDRATTVPGEALVVTTAEGSLVAVRTSVGIFVLDAQRGDVLASFAHGRREPALFAMRAGVVAIAASRALHLVPSDGRWIRMPLPSQPATLALTDGFVVAVASNELFAIDRASVDGDWTQSSTSAPHDAPLEIAPRADARRDDGVCLVRSVVRQFVALTEIRTQRHFNLTVDGAAVAARFAKGDRVFVTDRGL